MKVIESRGRKIRLFSNLPERSNKDIGFPNLTKGISFVLIMENGRNVCRILRVTC
jgi:hypothetical protein